MQIINFILYDYYIMKFITKKILKKINIPMVLLWLLIILIVVIAIYNLGIYFNFYEKFTMSLQQPSEIFMIKSIEILPIDTNNKNLKHLRIGEIKINDLSNNYTIDRSFSSNPAKNLGFENLQDNQRTTYYKSNDTPGKLRLNINDTKLETITITNCLYKENNKYEYIDNLKDYKIHFINKNNDIFYLLFTDPLCSDLFNINTNYTVAIRFTDIKNSFISIFKGDPGKDGINGKDGKDYIPIANGIQ